ncbi:MAG TPA: hypothetical protein VF992_02635 [Thermoplasmata archaeon]
MAVPSGIARKIRTILDVQDVPIAPPARRGGRSWLLHPRRLEVLLASAAYPGLHERSASRLLLLPLPSLRYHVEQLVAQGFLERRRYAGRTSLFASGMYPRASECFLVAWEDRIDRAILVALARTPKAAADAIAKAARISTPGAVAGLRRLAAIGAVRLSRDRVPRASLTAGWRAFERDCHVRTGARLDRFVALLQRDDLHPVVEPLDRSRVRITVDGPRSRIRFVLPLDPIARG